MNPSTDNRPSWDEYFIRIANDFALRGNCSRRRVGAVIVKDHHVISSGYNGTPMHMANCFDGGCPRCAGSAPSGHGLEECLCVHAEQNAICQAARYGLPIDGGTIYVTLSPCLTCAKMIVNSGLRHVVYSGKYSAGFEKVVKMLAEAGVSISPARKE